MTQQTWYVLGGPIPIPYENGDELVHTADNGYECDDPDCPCHWERRTQEEDDSPYEPPYTRADAEADLATAEYWDEVAKRRQV